MKYIIIEWNSSQSKIQLGRNTEDTVLNEIFKRYDLPTAVCVAFRYGIMQGKRMERAKKKRQSVTA